MIACVTAGTVIRRGQFINLPSNLAGRTCSQPFVVAHVNGDVVAFRRTSATPDKPLSFIKQHRVVFVCDTLAESREVYGMAA